MLETNETFQRCQCTKEVHYKEIKPAISYQVLVIQQVGLGAANHG